MFRRILPLSAIVALTLCAACGSPSDFANYAEPVATQSAALMVLPTQTQYNFDAYPTETVHTFTVGNRATQLCGPQGRGGLDDGLSSGSYFYSNDTSYFVQIARSSTSITGVQAPRLSIGCVPWSNFPDVINHIDTVGTSHLATAEGAYSTNLNAFSWSACMLSAHFGDRPGTADGVGVALFSPGEWQLDQNIIPLSPLPTADWSSDTAYCVGWAIPHLYARSQNFVGSGDPGVTSCGANCLTMSLGYSAQTGFCYLSSIDGTWSTDDQTLACMPNGNLGGDVWISPAGTSYTAFSTHSGTDCGGNNYNGAQWSCVSYAQAR